MYTPSLWANTELRESGEKKSDKFCWIINILRRFFFSSLYFTFGVWVDTLVFGADRVLAGMLGPV